MSLLGLPDDLVTTIAVMCDARTALSLSHVCTSFHIAGIWTAKLANLPPDVPRPTRAAALSVVESMKAFLSALRTADGEQQLTIAWGETPSYWTRYVPCLDSPFDSLSELRSVCWLDICGKRQVARGTYAVLMRIRFTNHFFGSALRRRVWIEGAPSDDPLVDNNSAPLSSVDLARLNLANRWLYLPLGAVHAPTEDTVNFQLLDHDGDWKAGLQVDHVRFVPIIKLEALFGEQLRIAAAGAAAAEAEEEAGTSAAAGSVSASAAAPSDAPIDYFPAHARRRRMEGPGVLRPWRHAAAAADAGGHQQPQRGASLFPPETREVAEAHTRFAAAAGLSPTAASMWLSLLKRGFVVEEAASRPSFIMRRELARLPSQLCPDGAMTGSGQGSSEGAEAPASAGVSGGGSG